jgi:hypothetical protein
MCPVNTNKIFCVQVKNKPCVKFIVVLHLIPWIRSRGSETLIVWPLPIQELEEPVLLSIKVHWCLQRNISYSSIDSGGVLYFCFHSESLPL